MLEAFPLHIFRPITVSEAGVIFGSGFLEGDGRITSSLPASALQHLPHSHGNFPITVFSMNDVASSLLGCLGDVGDDTYRASNLAIFLTSLLSRCDCGGRALDSAVGRSRSDVRAKLLSWCPLTAYFESWEGIWMGSSCRHVAVFVLPYRQPPDGGLEGVQNMAGEYEGGDLEPNRLLWLLHPCTPVDDHNVIDSLVDTFLRRLLSTYEHQLPSLVEAAVPIYSTSQQRESAAASEGEVDLAGRPDWGGDQMGRLSSGAAATCAPKDSKNSQLIVARILHKARSVLDFKAQGGARRSHRDDGMRQGGDGAFSHFKESEKDEVSFGQAALASRVIGVGDSGQHNAVDVDWVSKHSDPFNVRPFSFILLIRLYWLHCVYVCACVC